MNKYLFPFTTLSGRAAAELSAKCFAVALFLFIWLSGGLPAMAQTSLPTRTDDIELLKKELMSPRLAHNFRSDGGSVPNRIPAQSPMANRAPSADGDVDTGFNANVTEGFGYVEESVVQPDGKVIIGGSFNAVNGVPRVYLARVNADGSLDTTFNPGGSGPNAMVRAVALQPDGKILIGGNGAVYNNIIRGTVTRLNADGTPDASFNGSGSNAGGVIESIAVQTDGKILIGGSFFNFNGVPRSRVARLNADGSLDTTFNPGSGFADNIVLSVVPQPDGKVLVGGAFTTFDNLSAGRIVRLNADGSLDATFNTGGGANGSVQIIVRQPDGKILVGGYFSAFGGVPTTGIVRLSATGALETTITVPGITSATVTAIALQTNGKILVGGAFVDGTGTNQGLARFNADGSPDFLFNPVLTNGSIFSLVSLPDGRILAGGSFTQVNGTEHRRLVRIDSAGTVDGTLNISVNTTGIVLRIAPLANGKILIAGDFESVNGATRSNLARLNADGSLDPTFDTGSGTNNAIQALAIQADGKIIIGGSFISAYNGAAVNAIFRLNADGTLDTAFNFTRNPIFVADIKIQTDGKILFGGFLVGSNGIVSIERVNSDGSLDPTFNGSVISGFLSVIALQTDGKILVGGSFTLTTGGSAVARLNSNGSLDTTFRSPLQNGIVEVIGVLPDARILIGGTFSVTVGTSAIVDNFVRLLPNGNYDSTFNPPPPSGFGGLSGTVRALFVQPDGKILIGGFFTFFNATPVNRIIRLTANGTLDTTFTAGADDVVEDINLQTDGKILVGGSFTTFNGAPRRSLVRLQNSSATTIRRPQFDFDGDGKADVSVFRPDNGVWYLLQSQAGFSGIQFGLSTDKLVPADYDGDGKTDIAVYRNGTWYLQRSQLGFTGIAFGASDDIPVPGDYDGDGKADLAVFRPSNGVWYLQRSQLGFTGVQFGQSGDKPVAADYDGDGIADIAVNRSGVWYLQRSQLGFTGISFGTADDKLVPADYDGDGKADVAVFRLSNGVWYLQQSTNGFTGIQFGAGTDLPTAGDYDGDGKADLAVFRNGTWYLNRTTAGFTGVAFGASTDLPIPNAFVR